MLAVIVLISLTALLVLCLSLPLEIVVRLDLNERVTFRLHVLWLHGLVRRELRRENGVSVMSGLLQRSDGLKGIARALKGARRVKGLTRRFFWLLKGCLKSLSLKGLVARLRIALDSPADTGLLFAYLSPLSLASIFPRCDIDIEPSFEGDATIQGYVSAAVRVRLLRLLVAVAGFVFSPPVIRAFAGALWERWRERSGRKDLCPSPA